MAKKAAKDELDIDVVEDDSEIEGDIDEPEIEIVDDTPEADRGKKLRSDHDTPDIPNDDDISQYGKKAADRIKALRYEYHTERRTREAQARERDEAVNFARRQMEENARLKNALQHGEVQLVTQSKAGAEASLRAAETEYRSAFDEGDAEKMLDAQKKIAQATVSLNAVATYRPQYQTVAQPNASQQPVQAAPQQQRTQPQAAQPQTSTKTADWLSRNSWYGKDPEMTRYAQGVDERLRFQDGVDPRVDEDRYWKEVDQAVRKTFPERFTGTDKPRGRSIVAGASRTPSSRSNKVTLTQSEVGLAKRMGLTTEQYARSKRDYLEQNGE